MSLDSDPPDDAPRNIVSSFIGEQSHVASRDGGDLPAAPEAPPAVRYTEGGELGRGGMGRVRAAYDAVLRRTLALKRAKDDSPGAEARLLAEARITASLDHPGIITVLDAGRGADGGLYYVMRVVEGISLREVLEQQRSVQERVRLMLSVAQAMAYSHERGVVHRDLSPSNVRVGRHGEVVVMDWGLATNIDDAARGGVRCGTPGFTAPELREGLPAGPPADVFALGVLLALALTGELPAESPRRPRGCPAELWAIVVRCLRPAAAERYPTAQPLELDLRAWLDGERVSAHVPRPWTPVLRLARRHPTAVAVTCAAVMLLGVVTSTLGVRAMTARRDAELASAALLQRIADNATLEDDVAGARTTAMALEAIAPTSPMAAGVLAAFRRASGVTAAPFSVDEGCELLDARGGRRLCRAALEREEVATARVLASGAIAVFAPLDDGRAGVHLSSPEGKWLVSTPLEGGLQTVVASDDGRFLVATLVTTVAFIGDEGVTVVDVCPASSPGRFALPGPSLGHALVSCGDTLFFVTPTGATRGPTTGAKGTLRGAALDAEHFVTGTVHGQLAVMRRLDGQVVRLASSAVGPVREVASVDGVVVAVLGRDGLGFWRSDLDAWLHVEQEKVDELRRFGDAVATRHGQTWRTWSLSATSWHRARFEAGATSVAFSPTGDAVAVGGADSVVRLLKLERGELRSFVRELGGVVTQVAFAPSGRFLGFATAGPFGVDVYDLERGVRLEGEWRQELLRARFVAFDDDDTLIAIDYASRVRRYSVSSGQRQPMEQQLPSVHLAGISWDRSRRRVLSLMKDGALVEVTNDGSRVLSHVPGAQAMTVAHDGAVVLAYASHVERRDGQRLEVLGRCELPGADVTSVATSAQGLTAVARVDGRVDVCTNNRLTHTLMAHQTRAAAVALRGEQLVTVGWDGVVRLLQLTAPE